jgi:hypothetical protein
VAAAGVRIHPAWWSPRLFPYVLVMSGLTILAAPFVLPRVLQKPWTLAAFLPVALIAVLFVLQRRLCRIVLLPDAIVFPQWRWGDTSEMGIAIHLDSAIAKSDNIDRVTTLAADEIRDWTPEAGRIVVRTRIGQRDAISLSGIRERDRERIVAWLTEKVGG